MDLAIRVRRPAAGGPSPRRLAPEPGDDSRESGPVGGLVPGDQPVSGSEVDAKARHELGRPSQYPGLRRL